MIVGLQEAINVSRNAAINEMQMPPDDPAPTEQVNTIGETAQATINKVQVLRELAEREGYAKGLNDTQDRMDDEIICSFLAMCEYSDRAGSPRNQPCMVGAPTMRALVRVLKRHGYSPTSMNTETYD